jgi:hypothetical protein
MITGNKKIVLRSITMGVLLIMRRLACPFKLRISACSGVNEAKEDTHFKK